MTKKIRVSLVHYLNAAPLGWAFLHGPFRDSYEIIPSSPARCADELKSGKADIGLIPSVEYQRIPNLRIIPDIAIASLSEVRSILLVKPPGKTRIDSVAMDTNSRSSVVLTKILLSEVMGIRPEYIPHSPPVDAMLKKCDAALVIGDAALGVNLKNYDTTDLSEMWVRWQKKPFVFAFWACRTDASLPEDLAVQFQKAKLWGLERRREIASVYSERLKLPEDFLESYLINNINYDLGPEHIRGLEEYHRLAERAGYIRDLRPLQFLQP
ncbi:MAG: menaquinone biosynthesis protein [Acidobacteria bacterium]|nr:menaquinone biosynthesis protein [Acidobacteriota bacterium]